MIRALTLAVAGALATLAGPVAATCAVPEPVHALAYGSRYEAGTGSTVIDTAADAAVDEELGPVDDFIRALADAADQGDPACAMQGLTAWARAGALAELRSDTSKLTIGSRIAGFALVARKLRGALPEDEGWDDVHAWLNDLMARQRLFWEAEAPDGASRGNLRAWAALAGAAVADLTGDEVTRAWALWSATYVACTAGPEGALPQEMTRGKHALHYQLHAVAPLVVAAAIWHRQGTDLMGQCDGALERAARFAVQDLEDGAMSREITGAEQSFFDGTRQLGAFQLAWIEAYLTLRPDLEMDAAIAEMRPVSNSKLGGVQTGLWSW